MNNVTAKRDNASLGSSFVEVTGKVSISNASCSSTIRDMLDVDECLPPINEEPPYLTPDDAFTELCATCLHRDTRKEATHFCTGCGKYGRYMCGNCLKDHSLWCNKPEHEVKSLSVDRHSDPEPCYHTIDQSDRGRPNCRPRDNPVNDYVNSPAVPLQSNTKRKSVRSCRPRDNPVNDYVNSPAVPLQSNTKRKSVRSCRPPDNPVNDFVNSPAVPLQSNTQRENVRSWLLHKSNSDSENSEGTLINEHRTASTPDLSTSDGLSFDETVTTNYRRPKTSFSQNLEGQYENFTRRKHETTSHIYCDPIEMLHLPRIPDPYRRNWREPYNWEHMSTDTTRRLNDVYEHNEHNTQELAGWHTHEERAKKKKSCVIQ